MYTQFYGFKGKPFQLTPDPHFYFDSSTHHKAMAYLTYGLSQGEGFIIVTGEIGAGKTTLVARLLEELDTEQYVAAKIVTTHLDADDILRMVAAGFGLNVVHKEKSIILQEIETFLRRNHKKGKRALIIIDEVQNLPTGALEELRMLSNFQEGDRALLQSFLIGQPEFRDKWAFDPELEQLRQRVIATHHLQSMTYDETCQYIVHRLTLVGWQDNPKFEKSAFDKIYKYTNGVPRKLNTLCSRILLFGALEELSVIDEKMVSAVVDDMEADTVAAGAAAVHSQKISKKTNGEYGKSNNIAGSDQALNDINERLSLLEEYVKAHDDTIKGVLDLASSLLEKDKY